jgi:hypothetical protein
MRLTKIMQATVLLCAANSITVVALHQSPATKAVGQLTGTVVDRNDARVVGATVIVESQGVTRSVTSAEDGTYKAELPTGIYRIRVNSRGFCPSRRAPFHMQSSTVVTLNFTLVPCPLVNSIAIEGGKYVGETDRYLDPLKEEVFPLASSSGAPLELLVRYSERRESKGIIEYRNAAVSYNILMVQADKINFDRRTFRLEVEGNVLIETDNRHTRAKRAVIDLQKGEPKIEGFQ